MKVQCVTYAAFKIVCVVICVEKSRLLKGGSRSSCNLTKYFHHDLLVNNAGLLMIVQTHSVNVRDGGYAWCGVE